MRSTGHQYTSICCLGRGLEPISFLVPAIHAWAYFGVTFFELSFVRDLDVWRSDCACGIGWIFQREQC
ncbi:hypothetical protein BDW68DRAFT_166462 [Aspergillus falconensis]